MKYLLPVTVLAALIFAAPASARLSMPEAQFWTKHAIGEATRAAAKRTHAEIVGFDVVRSSCARSTSRVVTCRGWSELSYPTGEVGHCRHSVKVSETLSGGLTWYRRLITCYDL
jgi:hypothetical protein